MKKLFLSMLAAVTLFASCSQEELVSQADGENLVSFTVTTPELASRLAGDGKTAKNLYYAVYDADGNIVSTISNNNGEAIPLETTPTKVSLPLLNGETYSILFWAEADALPEDKMATVNWENKSLSVNPTTSNKETYDAFYAYVKPFVVTGDKTENVKLYRPFAQLNIGTTDEDLIRVAKYYGVTEFTKSQVVVTTPTSMDLTTGNVSGEKAFTYAAAKFITPEMLKTDYVYLSMNYLLVSNEKNLVNVEFSCISEGENAKSISKTFENIPVQRNYKTNIYGNLFTSARDWNVEVAPGFDATEYNPAEQLAALFEQGGEMTLYTDVTLAEPLVLEGKTVTLNLNGNTIKGGLFAESNGTISAGNTDSYPIWVKGGTLNIKGEGTIEAQAAKYSMAVFATAGEVNIYGGEFYNAGEGSDLIYAKGTAKINIFGGYFKACEKKDGVDGTAEKYSALNLHDGSKTTASITVYGGTFYQFDPANNKSENPAQSFVAKDYTSRLVGENYVVVEGTGVATAAELVTAIAAGGTVTLLNDIEVASSISIKNSVVINLNGNDIVAPMPEEGEGFDAIWVLTGGELVINGEGNVTGSYYSLYAGGDAKVTINGGNYFGIAAAIYAQSNAVVEINAGTFKAQNDSPEYGPQQFTLNIKDNTNAQILVKGGKYYKFDPANNTAEGPDTNFVVEGFTSVKEGDWYVVK